MGETEVVAKTSQRLFLSPNIWQPAAIHAQVDRTDPTKWAIPTAWPYPTCTALLRGQIPEVSSELSREKCKTLWLQIWLGFRGEVSG